MRVRYALENFLDHDGSSPLLLSKNIIECPELNDSVFRQGGSLVSYPGNVMIRSLIATKIKEQEKAQRKKLVLEIVEEIKGCEWCGRFLVWNELGWWNEPTNDKQIYPKIDNLIKECLKYMKVEQQKKKKKKRHKLNLKGGTFIFRSEDGGTTCTTFGNRLTNIKVEDNEYETGRTETTCTSECFGMRFSPL